MTLIVLTLGEWTFVKNVKGLGGLKKYGVSIVALTGTATSVTVELIMETLHLSNPKLIKLPFSSKNLIFEVLPKKSGFSAAMKQAVEIVNTRFSGQCGIVYCSHREHTTWKVYVCKLA